jgi:hypothetical protein
VGFTQIPQDLAEHARLDPAHRTRSLGSFDGFVETALDEVVLRLAEFDSGGVGPKRGARPFVVALLAAFETAPTQQLPMRSTRSRHVLGLRSLTGAFARKSAQQVGHRHSITTRLLELTARTQRQP